VGWGAGEDEEAGAILRVYLWPWGFFISIALKRGSYGVLASLRGSTYRSVRLASSLAAALCGTLFERDSGRLWVMGLCACLLLLDASAISAHDFEGSIMKRRQQGILTGMPFMTHVSSRSFVDDTGRKISLAKTPARIVSLAPSITEMLFAIGAGGQVAGVTQFCDFPPEAATKPKVGYANPNLESLVALQPDLILAPKEFLKPDLFASLDHLHIPLFVFSGQSVEDIFSQIQTIGRMTDHQAEAAALAMEVRRRIATVTQLVQGQPPVRVLYVLNSQPLITVGPGSFINELIELAGGLNVAAKSATSYPRLSMETVLVEDPEVLVFPVGQAEGISESEQQAWRQWSGLSAVKHLRLHQIPADLLNRPGPRIGQALERLALLLHPSLSEPAPSRRP
jgi:iron complex transport system substrate-binding protein